MRKETGKFYEWLLVGIGELLRDENGRVRCIRLLSLAEESNEAVEDSFWRDRMASADQSELNKLGKK